MEAKNFTLRQAGKIRIEGMKATRSEKRYFDILMGKKE